MSQQASLTKLKEQIEAAKRSLSEMPLTGGTLNVSDGDTANIDSDLTSKENSSLLNAKQIDNLKIANSAAVESSKIVKLEAAEVIEISLKKKTIDIEKTDHSYSSDANNPSEEFHFFYRKNQRLNTPPPRLNDQGITNTDTSVQGNTDDSVFNNFDRRLNVIEIDVAQNCLHIDELIKLSLGIESFQTSASTPKSMRHLVRRYVFWFVIGCLAIGWFALTPSGHVGLNYLLTLK